MSKMYYRIIHCLEDSRSSALCIVTSASGSVPGKVGAKMIVYSDGSIEGTVGGGAIEKQVIDDAIQAISTQSFLTREYDLGKDFAMTCGGNITVYIEPLKKNAKLYIFGAGHIGKRLAGYAPDMDFETYLIDWREDAFEKRKDLPYAGICKPYLEAAGEITFDDRTYCVIVTPDHEMDEDVLAALGKKNTAYLGLIGSRKKIDALKERFLRENILTKEELDKVDMPIGIKFNAVTPAEIAISILAKLIDVKNTRASGSKV